MPLPHRARAAGALVLVGALTLAGCSRGDESPAASGAASPAPSQSVTSAPKVKQQTWPLTGLRVAKQQSAAQHHPVMVLKMDNTSSSAPQKGLGSADMVVEELVEGGLTRLAAFYYSKIPGVVGPVRSMRASDIGIVSPVHGAMVTSGAAPVTIRRISGAGIRFFNEGSKGFFRDTSRSAPYNLFTNLSQTATLVATKKAVRPPNYLPWGRASKLPKGAPARSMQATFSYGHTTSWAYEDGHYRNTNTNAAQGDQFLADTVLVLRVQVGDAGYLDPAGNPVPETHLVGKGSAMLLHRGRVVQAQWAKKSLGSRLTLSVRGKPLRVPPGHTWLELVPAATGTVTIGR
ncbi:DUF3048 domain-containing protein [Nocardioides acrostichi]|uniref:DUF3048 domain-containing protein n=1 Tax=Nocardioides acrostichi TaxID=2784339 RepID=A0A930UXG5_9ACTN|nr:DUF3048 domain-containing protein [Nocardioides acrostichi]MBF4160066.1 DUF3048 domain-containing protein [Nocardioides acrostichi]